MYPLNDNDLDRLSREAADQYDVELSTSGWEALETRLNRELPLKEDKERRRFLFWLFLIVLLAGGGVLYTMTGNNPDRTFQLTVSNTVPANQVPGVESNTPAAAAGPNTTTAAGNDQSRAVVPSSAQTGVDAPADKTSTNGTASTASGKPATKKAVQSPGDNEVPVTAAGTAKTKANDHLNDLVKDDPIMADRKTTSGRRTATKNGPLTGAYSKGKASNATEHTLKGRTTEADPYLVSAPMAEELLVPSAVREPGIKAGPVGPIKAPVLTLAVNNGEPSPSKIQRKREPHGFELGLVAGPDMSNVKFTDMDKLGYNAGLQIGYRFNNRWSVNTGFLYTHKNYTVQGEDFTKPNYGWWRWIDLTLVKGYCEMYELPLNVRYDFSVSPKQRWYASAGASSYFMTEESYTYDYLYNGVPQRAPRTYDSSTNYIFSILNLSVGYERAVGKRLSIQAEPYFKIPTRGLGYGKLNLNSYGIYFGLKYKLHK